MNNTTSNHYIQLDFIKVMATIMIIFHHYQQIFGVYFYNHVNYYFGLFDFGRLVELFFLISGIVISKHEQSIQNSDQTFKKFFINRYLRLILPIMGSVIAYETISYYAGIMNVENWLFETGINPLGAVVALLGISAWGILDNPMINNPIWYVSVLFLCYLIFYLILKASRKLNCSAIYFYILIIVLGIYTQLLSINIPLLNYSTSRGYIAFFFGVILSHRINKTSTPSLPEVITCIILIMLFIHSYIHYYNYIKPIILYLLVFILYPSLIRIIMATDFILIKHSIWTKLNRYAYYVFVMHLPTLFALFVGINLNIIHYDITLRFNMFLFALISYIIGIIYYYIIYLITPKHDLS